MQAWHEFYEMIGGAAATLLGLLFVSVSLNAELILGGAHGHSKRLAEQAFQNYLAVIVVALLVVMPAMLPVSIGYTLVIVSGLWGTWALVRMYQALAHPRAGESRVGPLRRYLTTLTGFGLLIAAGDRLISGANDYAQYIAPGVMFLLISATVVSWELLVKVAEEKYRVRAGGPG